MLILACTDNEKDTLLWRLNELFVQVAKEHGDDTLHFSGVGHVLPEGGDAFESGHLVLTDQHLYVTCENGGTVHHMFDVTCVLDLTMYKDAKCLRVETDEGNILLRGGAPGSDCAIVELFLAAFTDQVLPLEVQEETSIAPFAAEAKYPVSVTEFLGLSKAEVAAHVKVDAIEALEQKRRARLEEEKQKAEEMQREAEAAKEDLRQKMEAGRAKTQEAHEKGMRRLSMKRRKCENVQRNVKRWILAGNGYESPPAWWVGEFNEAQDPYVMPEERINEISDNLAEQEEQRRLQHLERVRAVLGELESREGSMRRMIEGEARLAFADVKEQAQLAAVGFREQLRELKRKLETLIYELEKAEYPDRHRIEAEEEADRFRLQLAKSNNNTRLDGLAKLLRSTHRDEERMREELTKLELRTREDLERREQKECRRAQKLRAKRDKEEESGKVAAAAATTAPTDDPEHPADTKQLQANPFGSIARIGERNLNRTLLARTQSVHRRNLLLKDCLGKRRGTPQVPEIAIHRVRNSAQWDAISGSSPLGSPRSPRSYGTESMEHDYDVRSSGSSSADSDLSYYERVMATHLQSPPAFRPRRRGSGRSGQGAADRGVAGGHVSAMGFESPLLSLSERQSVPSSPAQSTASLARSVGGMSPRKRFLTAQRAAGEREKAEKEKEKHPEPPTPVDFTAQRISSFEAWRNELRSNLGVKLLTDPPARRAAVAAAAALLAIAATPVLPTPLSARLQPGSPRGGGVPGASVTAAPLNDDACFLTPSRWDDAVLSLKPRGGHSLVYTYTPVKTHKSFTNRQGGTSGFQGTPRQTPRTSPRGMRRSTTGGGDTPGGMMTPPPSYARALRTTPTSYRQVPSSFVTPTSSMRRRSPSPRRNKSPLRGGGELAGAYVCTPKQQTAGWLRG